MGSVEQFANTVWDDLGNPASPSLIIISGWALANLGKLSIEIDEQYQVNSGDFNPDFSNQVSGIYQELYNIKFYEKQIRMGLDGINYIPSQNVSGDIMWTEMQEEGQRIKRVSPTEVLKTYKSLLDSAKQQYSDLVFTYNMNKSKPIQTTGDDDIIQRQVWP